jgi:hypothetical protein
MWKALAAIVFLATLSAGCANGGKAKLSKDPGPTYSRHRTLFTPDAQPAPSRRLTHDRQPAQSPDADAPDEQQTTPDEPQTTPDEQNSDEAPRGR